MFACSAVVYGGDPDSSEADCCSSPITLSACDCSGLSLARSCVCDLDHSSLIPVSKNPENCANIRRCKRYLFSCPSHAITISTSPVCAKNGNSFCDGYEDRFCRDRLWWCLVLPLLDEPDGALLDPSATSACDTMSGTPALPVALSVCPPAEFVLLGALIRSFVPLPWCFNTSPAQCLLRKTASAHGLLYVQLQALSKCISILDLIREALYTGR